MDLSAYQRYLQEYVLEAMQNSDGTTAKISEYLWNKNVGGLLTRQKAEKQKALIEARRAFDEYRHWPVDIILSHLGISRDA
jgi:hypothetical protein